MVDHQFVDVGLAVLYDLFYPWDKGKDFGFYLPLTMSAETVPDVGWRTVSLLHAALSVIRSILTGNGRFAFETRNPLVRAWENWTRPCDS